MRNMPAIVVGAVGGAFLVASLVSDLTEEGRPSYSSLNAATVQTETAVPTVPVIRSGFDGRILFGTDSVLNTNYLSRRANEPVAILKHEGNHPASKPGIRHESRDEPQKEKKRRPQVFGCMTSVSPLAHASADQHPSLCLAHRADGRSLS